MIIFRIWLSAIWFISVLCEIMHTMRPSWLVILVLASAPEVLGLCPSLCSCRSNKSGDASEVGELKLKCGGSPAQITELKEIDLSNESLRAAVVSL